MSTEPNDRDFGFRSITIQIDPSLHMAMRELSKKKQVHLSYLYGEAIEQYIDAAAAKKTLATKKS